MNLKECQALICHIPRTGVGEIFLVLQKFLGGKLCIMCACSVGLVSYSSRAQGNEALSLELFSSLSFTVSTFPLSSRGVVKTDSCLKSSCALLKMSEYYYWLQQHCAWQQGDCLQLSLQRCCRHINAFNSPTKERGLCVGLCKNILLMEAGFCLQMFACLREENLLVSRENT